jgi:excisionase family DNA binding protein
MKQENIKPEKNLPDMLFKVSEVAKILGTGVNTVYKLINLGYLRCLKLGSQKILRDELEDFLHKYNGEDIDELLKANVKAVRDDIQKVG